MSLFSSLNYFLNIAGSTFNQTASAESPPNAKLKELWYSNKVSLIDDSENFSSETKTHNLFDLPTFGTNSISLLKVLNFTSESEDQFSNETYHDANHLLKNWWNVFDERYLRHDWGWTITLIIAYMSILVAGVIGNIMVILVVLLRPHMRTVTNMFIMNLAVADLFVLVFCVPSTLLANIFTPWILGSFMCKAVAYVQGVSVCASAYSLAAISLDRCQAVYRNYERPRGFSQTICVRTVLIIWTGAMCLTVPWAVAFEVKESEFDGLRHCVETWRVGYYGNMYFILITLACFYAIPLLLIFVSNWIIYCHVMHRNVPQDSASSAPIKKLHRQTRHVVLRMLGIVTLTFLLSWFPLYTLVVIVKFSENISESEYKVLGILMPIAQWLGSWNSCINPILYAFLNKKFRRMFKSILPAWIPVKGAGMHRGSNRTRSFTATAYTVKSLGRSRTNSKSDYHHHHHHQNERQNLDQNERRNILRKANLLFSRFYEGTGTIPVTTIQIIATTLPVTAVLKSSCLDNILDATITEKIATVNKTEL